jgi:prepilin-type N-terminal cleavage/methylation domain-containing protein
MERPVDSGQRSVINGQRTQGCLAANRSANTAFTLIEMLIVIGIIAMLSALTLPALQGLVGVSGVRGGVNTVLAALDQARAAAIENGCDAYVGFPPASFTIAGDPGVAFSSVIVFRGQRPDEPPNTFKPISRWVRLPAGVLVRSTNMTLTNAAPSVAASIPKLAGTAVEPLVIRYDRFGRVDRTSVQTNGALVIGEGLVVGGQPQWKGTNTNTLERLAVQRLTGRWIVSTNQ